MTSYHIYDIFSAYLHCDMRKVLITEDLVLERTLKVHNFNPSESVGIMFYDIVFLILGIKHNRLYLSFCPSFSDSYQYFIFQRSKHLIAVCTVM